ncbi:MAG: hypothetical protein K1X61_01510 [Chitinophagales bacterium]|nr:hypothetical protein [Chitinophagales bacterium]
MKSNAAFESDMTKVPVHCSENSFADNATLPLLINLCGKNRQLSQSANHCTISLKQGNFLPSGHDISGIFANQYYRFRQAIFSFPLMVHFIISKIRLSLRAL